MVLGGWRLWKLGRVPADVVVAGTLALSFWLLAGANEKEGRDAAASRYVYIGVVFALMIAANLLRGVRLGRWALAGTFAVLAITVASNLSFLNQAHLSYKATSDLERADLGALEIARDTVDPGFRARCRVRADDLRRRRGRSLLWRRRTSSAPPPSPLRRSPPPPSRRALPPTSSSHER